jgi:hypothetical protein
VTGGLLALMAEMEPGLSAEAVLGALEQAAARHDGRHRIAAAVTAQPGLLTGEGARAPVPGVLRFISALARAGATSVVDPPCPRSQQGLSIGLPDRKDVIWPERHRKRPSALRGDGSDEFPGSGIPHVRVAIRVCGGKGAIRPECQRLHA